MLQSCNDGWRFIQTKKTVNVKAGAREETDKVINPSKRRVKKMNQN